MLTSTEEAELRGSLRFRPQDRWLQLLYRRAPALHPGDRSASPLVGKVHGTTYRERDSDMNDKAQLRVSARICPQCIWLQLLCRRVPSSSPRCASRRITRGECKMESKLYTAWQGGIHVLLCFPQL